MIAVPPLLLGFASVIFILEAGCLGATGGEGLGKG